MKSESLSEQFNNISLKCVNDSEKVTITGFVDSIRLFGKRSFVIIRNGTETIQVICFKDELKDKYVLLKQIKNESFLKVTGEVKLAEVPIKSCTVTDKEISMTDFEILGDVYASLPFNPKDIASADTQARSNVSYGLRLDNRFLDLRLPHAQAISKLTNGLMFGIRKFLHSHDFLEIKTPKIIKSGSEGGANLFKIDFFGTDAYLAQSAQLYKQMSIVGGLKKVFEIGPSFRAEVSNINRYLSEFNVIDLEMEIHDDYLVVVKFIYSMLVSTFDYLTENYKAEIETLTKFSQCGDFIYPREAFVIRHSEAVDLLKKEGYVIGYEDDFNREQEKKLGDIIKQTEGCDIFIVIDYPVSQRPFYTYVDKTTGKTRSYDFIMRGVEILSGAQRETNPDNLTKAIQSKGISPESLDFYVEIFKYGAPPHGGCGIGMERLMMNFVGFKDIRYFSLFPRDPNRLNP